MGAYPKVLSESETIARAAAGWSLARYGDGEYSLIRGGNCVSQRQVEGIGKALQSILLNPPPMCLPCIPNIQSKEPMPADKRRSWEKYTAEPYTRMLAISHVYGSSFVSRPDSAPWIDKTEYWESVRALWRRRPVILCTGRYNEIRVDQLDGSGAIIEITAPRQHAYEEIDTLEREIRHCWALMAGDPVQPIVLLCLGPTATVLAARLSAQNIQTLDLGHLGMFMRHAGQYEIGARELITLGYADELMGLHARDRDYGSHGADHLKEVRGLIRQLEPKTVLDYGCGRETLRDAMAKEFRILGYDPAIKGRQGLPKPVDLVVCTDVLQHVEPKLIGRVLAHIRAVAEVAVYFVITPPATKRRLPGGRNAHLIEETSQWWISRLTSAGFSRLEILEQNPKKVRALAYR